MSKIDEALKIAHEGILIHHVDSPEYKVCAALIQQTIEHSDDDLPEWIKSDQWLPVGRVIENENDDLFDISLEYLTLNQPPSDREQTAIAHRIALLLNMSSGVSTQAIDDFYDSFHAAFDLCRD